MPYGEVGTVTVPTIAAGIQPPAKAEPGFSVSALNVP